MLHVFKKSHSNVLKQFIHTESCELGYQASETPTYQPLSLYQAHTHTLSRTHITTYSVLPQVYLTSLKNAQN
jgi:hypothetical protein